VGNNKGNCDGGKSNGNGNKGGRQAMTMVTKRVMVTAKGWQAKDGYGNEESNGNSNKGGGRQRGQWQWETKALPITQRQAMDQVRGNPANKQQQTIDKNNNSVRWLAMIQSECSG
jgi:hypothetical protein